MSVIRYARRAGRTYKFFRKKTDEPLTQRERKKRYIMSRSGKESNYAPIRWQKFTNTAGMMLKKWEITRVL